MSESEQSRTFSSRAQGLSVRLHGRGGQGAVTAANILALAAHLAGHQVRANPLYGPERRGAPVASFLRISSEPIRLKCQIYRPDCVMVLDARLPQTVPVLDGLKEGGIAIFNQQRPLEGLRGLERVAQLAWVDATAIAKEVLGSPITNTTMVGAFARVFHELFTMEAVAEAIRRTFPDPGMGENNFRAAQQAYERCELQVLRKSLS